MEHNWVVIGTKGSLSRIFYEASVVHQEGHLISHLVVIAKPDPADDMGGQIKQNVKNPPIFQTLKIVASSKMRNAEGNKSR